MGATKLAAAIAAFSLLDGRPDIMQDAIICAGLAFAGADLDHMANREGRARIHAKGSRIGLYVVRTNEELSIARAMRELVGGA